MLGRLVRELPVGDYVYEPKWDGFRCIVFRDRDSVNLRSRHDRPLARYFPELAVALSRIGHPRFVIDGEILIPIGDGHDFTALMTRLHPAHSRVEQLSAAAPARLVAFDALRSANAICETRRFTSAGPCLRRSFRPTAIASG